MISPAYIGTAPAHDTSDYILYTCIWNFVDYPAVIVPTPIKAEKGGEKYEDGETISGTDEDKYAREVYGDGSQFEGAPVSLQVTARRHHDNELFGALKLMSKALELS